MKFMLHTNHSAILYALRGYEAISALFHFELDIDTSETNSIAWLHKNIGFQVNDQVFHGQVIVFTDLGSQRCRLKLAPALSQLNQEPHSRIYKDMSVVDIAKELLEKFPTNFSQLQKSYRSRAYCVQYQETPWAFIERVLAEEGISYYFSFTQDQHTLMLSDQVATSSYETSLYHSSEKEDGYLLEWIEHCKQGVNHFSSVDYNPEAPQQSLQLSRYLPTNSPGDFEFKVYPGGYESYARGEELLRYRLETYVQSRYFVLARSCYQNLKPRLLVHLYQQANQDYLITEVWHEVEDLSHQTMRQPKASGYTNKFKAIRQSLFRPPLLIKRQIANAQVAMVVGEKAQAPAVDFKAEVLIAFEWDEAKLNIPARIAMPWAGALFGLQFFPRVGDKVLVYFINGDPERPLIWGALNDSGQPPLYDLQSSGIRTHNDERFNELRFDDQQLLMSWHAARDFLVEVGRDAFLEAQSMNMQIAEGEAKFETGGTYTLNATESIEFQVGNSVIKISPDKIILAAPVIRLN